MSFPEYPATWVALTQKSSVRPSYVQIEENVWATPFYQIIDGQYVVVKKLGDIF